MTTSQLVSEIRKKKSFLCIGLDVDLDKIPSHLQDVEDPIFAFNRAIIDATHHFCVAYKPNTAFYEAHGVAGWNALEKTIRYLNETHPEIFTIADAKRGDIGHTGYRYAKAFFETLAFDAVTVNPYMGRDSVLPFLAFENKHTILLALTSNTGAYDFQTNFSKEKALYQKVLKTSKAWGSSECLMYVVGATKAEYLSAVRSVVPDHFLLVPGVGTQGGSLREVCKYGMNHCVGLLVNASRDVLYASAKSDFAEAAAKAARGLQQEMQVFL